MLSNCINTSVKLQISLPYASVHLMRNPSAHTGELTQVNARDCFDMVIDVEKLLRRMLNSFDK